MPQVRNALRPHLLRVRGRGGRWRVPLRQAPRRGVRRDGRPACRVRGVARRRRGPRGGEPHHDRADRRHRGDSMSYDCPPPTSYRDAHGTFHPGPGCNGYREHMVACDPCLSAFIRAGAAGEAWAMATPPVVQPVWPSPSRALATAPRSLPARWRRYASPVPLICFACGAARRGAVPGLGRRGADRPAARRGRSDLSVRPGCAACGARPALTGPAGAHASAPVSTATSYMDTVEP